VTCIWSIKHVVHCRDCGETWVDEDEECTCTCTGPGLETWTVIGDDDDDYFEQSATACCPRQTIPDSCSCLEGCECVCLECTCGEDDGDDFPEYEVP